ncbi:MAG: hypothetical protein KAS04_07140, partial [Candidatus Aenigmarchaeota archaeon]|nr:hypothetical protein [Candidatus Aenigmarchaeota archaeon]
MTVAEQRDIESYGSIAAREQKKVEAQVDAEIKALGLDKISSTTDYATKYAAASTTTKKYLQKPEEFTAAIKKSEAETIAANKIKIEAKIKEIEATAQRKKDYYREREKKYKKRGDDARARKYDDKGEEYEEYYKGVISELKKGIGKPYSYSDIYSYAMDVGRYERDKQEARNEGRSFKYQKPGESKTAWEERLIEQMREQGRAYQERTQPKMTVEMETIAPQILGPKEIAEMKRASRIEREKKKKLIIKEPPVKPYDYGQATPIIEPRKYVPTVPKKKEFVPSTMYLGRKEITTRLQPHYGTIIETGLAGVKPSERIVMTAEDIKAEYATTLEKRLTEFIPFGAGTALSQLEEPVYLPSNEDTKKFINLLEKKGPTAAANVRKFLRDQAAKLKRDLGRYNQLSLKADTEKGITQEEYDESVKLKVKIEQGQRGTLRDIVYEATEEAKRRGEKARLFGARGIEVSPRAVGIGLTFTEAAYKAGVRVLAAQAAIGTAGLVAGATPTGVAMMSTIGKVTAPLK